ncbi:hypothetical protein [Catellatospora sichuanensis]|uniref:hypothetical protein n=1 Tax=Catellatospora sichuanensis TaxID=1969805 RepID=UPI0011845D90|nr:hypothetical protein [Catellatospora sichuanensis]
MRNLTQAMVLAAILGIIPIGMAWASDIAVAEAPASVTATGDDSFGWDGEPADDDSFGWD